MRGPAALLVMLAMVGPAGAAAGPVAFDASFDGSFAYALFTGHVLPEWTWYASGAGGGAPMGQSQARTGASTGAASLDGACVVFADGYLGWTMDGAYRGDYLVFLLAGRVCPTAGPAGPGFEGQGRLDVAGGGGRFAGAEGAGTWRFLGEDLFPYVFLHDGYWDYAGFQGAARLAIAGDLVLP